MTVKSSSWRCGICKRKELTPTVLDYEAKVTHDGRTYTFILPALRVWRCGQCGCIVLDREADQKVNAALRAAAGLLTPQEICKGREALGLSREQLAGYLRISGTTLTSLESGQLIQPLPLDQLLRLCLYVFEAREFLAQSRTAHPGDEKET